MAEKLLDLLPDDLKQEPMFKDIPDVATLAKVARDLKAFQGTAVRVPGPDAGDAVLKEFREKMQKADPTLVSTTDLKAVLRAAGVPEDEKGYVADGVEIPEGVTIDKEGLAKSAKELGLTVTAYKKLVERNAAEASQALQAARAAEKALRSKWATAYDEKVALAKAAASRMGIPADAVARLTPADLEVWDNVAKGQVATRQVGEQGGGGTSRGGLTRQEIEYQIAETRSNPDYFSDKNPAMRAALQRKVAHLTEQLVALE